MKKPDYKIKTEIVSNCKDPALLFKALSIVLGEKTILDLWEKASKKIRPKAENQYE
jgi:hypothetical protein